MGINQGLITSVSGVQWQAMRWLMLWAVTVTSVFAQSYSGTVFDLETGRTQVISGEIEPEYKPYQPQIDAYKKIIADTQTRIDRMRAESEAREQTHQLRMQTELLRNMSEEKSSGSSSSYVPPPRIVAPSSYVPPTSTVPQESKEERAAKFKAQQEVSQKNDAIRSAKGARSFNAANKQPRERQLSANESPEIGDLNSPKNDKLIEGLLQGYKGNFTDYAWSAERVDNQTFIVTCSASLDGISHDFRFRVNNAVGTCRYEGGTALSKLAPPPPKRKITFLDGDPTDAELTDAELEALGLERVPYETDEFGLAIPIAKSRQNFSGFGKKPVDGVVSDPVEEDSNSQLITEWIENYAGEFADYGWRSAPIDAQTLLVICEVSLDGEKHDFRFQVNTELMTCRYEGGTAYEKLRSNQRKTSWLPW